MQHQPQLNAATRYPRYDDRRFKRKATAKAHVPAPSPKAPIDWKPEPCGLTRDELRQIVEDMLG